MPVKSVIRVNSITGAWRWPSGDTSNGLITKTEETAQEVEIVRNITTSLRKK